MYILVDETFCNYKNTLYVKRTSFRTNIIIMSRFTIPQIYISINFPSTRHLINRRTSASLDYHNKSRDMSHAVHNNQTDTVPPEVLFGEAKFSENFGSSFNTR